MKYAIGLGDTLADPSAPALILEDTDLVNDCDDAGAIAVLHALQTAGRCTILAHTVDATCTSGPPLLSAIDTYYGRGSIPIGANKGTALFASSSSMANDVAASFSSTVTYSSATEAVALLRTTLAAAATGTVRLFTHGTLTLAAALLASAADGSSALGGSALVSAKVSELVVMGGQWPSSVPSGGAEFNMAQDAASAHSVVAGWPTRVVFSGYDNGVRVLTGATLTGTPAGNPVRRAYADFAGAGVARASWDLVAALYAALGRHDQTGLVLFRATRGTASVDGSTGHSTFVASSSSGTHYYLSLAQSSTALAALLDDYLTRAP